MGEGLGTGRAVTWRYLIVESQSRNMQSLVPGELRPESICTGVKPMHQAISCRGGRRAAKTNTTRLPTRAISIILTFEVRIHE